MLLASTACGSECSASGGSHPCSDDTHFVECAGGEGYEYDRDVACPETSPVCMDFKGSSLCRSHEESECVVLDDALRASTVRAADLNGDGLTDLVFLGGSLFSALAVPAGGFAAPTELAQSINAFDLVELTQDGVLDLLLFEPGKLVLLPGVGDGSFDAHAARVLREGVGGFLGVVDVDADGLGDVVVRDGADRLTVLPGATDFEPAPLELAPPPNPQRVFSADFDGDGIAELLVEGAQAQIGSYRFDVDAWIETDTFRGSIAFLADLNADDRPDLVVNEANSPTVTVRLGQPGGGFEASSAFDGEAFLADDLNADGHVDLLLRRSLRLQLVRLDGHGDGTFTESAPLDIHDEPRLAQKIVTGSETRVVYAGGAGYVAELKAACLARP